MKERLIWTVLLFFGALQFSLAQEKTVTGTVKDVSGTPLLGVTVTVKGSTRGIATDFDGNYSIKVNTGETLRFMGIGLKTVERTVSASTSKIDVVMEEEAKELEEVVVVGYGSERKVGTVVGSIARVGGEEIAQRPGNAVDAMQGKVAGVQIMTSSGEPSALSSIKLHGMGSLGASSTPLFVVDGVPVSQAGVRSLNQADFE